ncbi:unnamed protein product, partial [Meganyctiphanes norvegica]
MEAQSSNCGDIIIGNYVRLRRSHFYFLNHSTLLSSACSRSCHLENLNLICSILALTMCHASFSSVDMGCRQVSQLNQVRQIAVVGPHYVILLFTVSYASLLAVGRLVSLMHTGSHIANAVNFSLHFSNRFPNLNQFSARGENPAWFFILTVPGVTGVLMVLILVILVVSSSRWARRRNYDAFYYTHVLGLVFLGLMLVHPLSGALKEQSNINIHYPGCRPMHNARHHKEEAATAPPCIVPQRLNNSKTVSHDHGKGYHKMKPVKNMTVVLSSDIASSHLTSANPMNKLSYEPESSYLTSPNPMNKLSYEPEPFPEPDAFPEPEAFPEPHYEILEYDETQYEEAFPEPDPDIFKDKIIDRCNLSINKQIIPKKTEMLIAHFSTAAALSNNFYLMKKPAEGNMDGKGRMKIKDTESEWKQKRKKKKRICKADPIFVPINTTTWRWVTVAMVIWSCDWLLRWWRRREPVEIVAVLKHTGCDVMEITLKQPGFSCHPGQFVLLQCLQVSRLEWHPFTVTSLNSAGPDTFTVYMRTRGDWTSQVGRRLRPTPTKQIDIQNIYDEIQPMQKISKDSLCRKENMRKGKLENRRPSSVISSVTEKKSASNDIYSDKMHNKWHYPTSRRFSVSSSPSYISTQRSLNHQSFNSPPSNHFSLPTPHHSLSIPRASSHSFMLPPVRIHCHLENSRLNRNKRIIYDKRLSRNIFYNDNEKQFVHNLFNDKHKYNNEHVIHMRSPVNIRWEIARKSNFRVEPRCLGAVKDLRGNTFAVPSYVCVHVIYVDGPFSSPSSSMLSFPVVIGAAGGVGITPLAATLNHILMNSGKSDFVGPRNIHVVWVARDARLFLSLAPLLVGLLEHCWENQKEDALELRLHLTTPTPQPVLKALFVGVNSILLPRIIEGRPVWKQIFRDWRTHYSGTPVGVFACGPKKMCRQVKRHCLQAIALGAKDFSYHQESFV